METGVIFAGFGGQGILLAGKVLARAGMNQGLEVTWLPSYGPEMRGGTANCTVILSDQPIGSPIVDSPHALVAMNGPSLDRFEPQVLAGGVVVMNSSLINRGLKRKDVQGIPIPVNDIAHELGEPRAINMVALGALVRAIPIVSLRATIQAMTDELSGRRRELVEANRTALERGYAQADLLLSNSGT